MKQPEALRLAEILEGGSRQFNAEAAAELRRLHAVNDAAHRVGIQQEGALMKVEAQRDALLEALERSRAQWIHSVNAEQCLAAIAKAQQ